MKNSNKTDSPKTPGGISKSHLTPIRRLGLSRNWRKSGSSPFISPLSGCNTITQDAPKTSIKENRKRKGPVEDENSEVATKATVENKEHIENKGVDESNAAFTGNETEQNIVATPTRTVSLPRKKKSKILKSNTGVENDNNLDTKSDSTPQINSEILPQDSAPLLSKVKSKDVSDDIIESYVEVKTKPKPRKNTRKQEKENNVLGSSEIKVQVHVDASETENCKSNNLTKTKQKSPKELTKECIVVIQKKIFKNELKKEQNNVKPVAPSQILFDSDSDDVPLNQLHKSKSTEVKENLDTIDEDFVEPKVNVKMLTSKTTSTTGLKLNNNKNKNSKGLHKTQKRKENFRTDIIKSAQAQEETFDDDDDDEDFQIDNKRTILIRKSYEKVSKLSRAKSTGSITQKDIDDLKARIEMKKKLLMAKSINKDTVELRELIKKWQKGCQDALAELMDLMKIKFPDKHNMDYSEILETLKIPASLVGYDSDNDCFVTPTDENIVLSKLNNL